MRAREQVRRPWSAWVGSVVAVALLASCSAAPAAAPTPTTGPAGTSSPGATLTPPGPAATPATLSKVSLQPQRAATATIGRDGGAIETTDATGNAYLLTVPPDALTSTVEIVVTPIDNVDGLPDELTVAGGVHVQPEGLTLWNMAELTITLAQSPPGALASIAYRGDLDQPQRYPATIDGASAAFGLAHFSGYALLSATTAATSVAELGLLIPFDPPAGPDDQALASIAAVIDGPSSPARDQAVRDALRTWIDSGIRPLVAQFRAQTVWDFDGPYTQKASDVIRALSLWGYVQKLLTVMGAVPDDPALEADFAAVAVSGTTHGIATTNTNCLASPTGVLVVLRLPEEFNWLSLARQVGIDGSSPELNEDFILEHLCAAVVFDPNGGTDFPTGIQPGQTGTLNVRVGIRVEDAENRFDAQPNVTVTPHGAEPSSVVSGRADSDGRFTRQFLWDPASPELRLDINACLMGALDRVCQQAFVVRGSAPPTATPGGPCPRYEVTLNGEVHSSTEPEGVSVSGDTSRGSALPSRAILLTAFNGGTAGAKIEATYTVDTAQAGGGPFDITVVFYGRARDDSGGMGTVTLTVGDNSKTWTSPLTDVNGTDLGTGPDALEFPLTVSHGDTIRVTVSGMARSAEGRSTIMSGSINFLGLPDQVRVVAPECP